MPEDRGVLLNRTYRMHQALTAFVSDLSQVNALCRLVEMGNPVR